MSRFNPIFFVCIYIYIYIRFLFSRFYLKDFLPLKSTLIKSYLIIVQIYFLCKKLIETYSGKLYNNVKNQKVAVENENAKKNFSCYN